jgi:hypothetical protein
MAGYDPETLVLLRTALDEAWAVLPDKAKSEILKSEMARRILKRAAEGERSAPSRQSQRFFSAATPCHTRRIGSGS